MEVDDKRVKNRVIISREPDGEGERAELACGHSIISVVGPVGENAPCPECINELVRENRLRRGGCA